MIQKYFYFYCDKVKRLDSINVCVAHIHKLRKAYISIRD